MIMNNSKKLSLYTFFFISNLAHKNIQHNEDTSLFSFLGCDAPYGVPVGSLDAELVGGEEPACHPQLISRRVSMTGKWMWPFSVIPPAKNCLMTTLLHFILGRAWCKIASWCRQGSELSNRTTICGQAMQWGTQHFNYWQPNQLWSH